MVPIDISWIDYGGTPQLTRKALLPGRTFSQVSYYTHPWTFAKPSDGEKLKASANGIEDLIFEGEAFGALPESTLLVLIKESGNLI